MKFLLMFALCAALYGEQTSPKWQSLVTPDPLRGTESIMYTLEGKYLTAPMEKSSALPPTLALKCQAKESRIFNGTYLGGTIMTWATLNRTSDGLVRVTYRLDDGKLKTTTETATPDGSVRVSEFDLNQFFYGHDIPHEPNTNPAIKKLVLGVSQHVGDEVVIEFDLPDPEKVANDCGVTYKERKRKK